MARGMMPFMGPWPDPCMVKVLPEPVCPYEKRHTCRRHVSVVVSSMEVMRV